MNVVNTANRLDRIADIALAKWVKAKSQRPGSDYTKLCMEVYFEADNAYENFVKANLAELRIARGMQASV